MVRGARILALGAGLLATAAPARAQSSFADATSMSWDGVLTGIFLGLLLFSLAYNAVFYRLLRERFLIWQSVRAMSYFALAIALSPLAMGAWLAPDSFARQVWITIFFDLSVVVSGVFLRSYLEPGMVGPRLYRWLGWPPTTSTRHGAWSAQASSTARRLSSCAALRPAASVAGNMPPRQ